MARELPKLRQLDHGRLASLLIRMTTALIFRGGGLPSSDENTVRRQDAFLQVLYAGATLAQNFSDGTVSESIRKALSGCDRSVPKEDSPAAKVLSRRITDFWRAVDSFDSLGSTGTGENECLTEIRDVLGATATYVECEYRKVAGHLAISWPQVFLETAPHHGHQTTDILDTAAATGFCRYDDADEFVSIVGLGIKDNAFSWATMCQLPYVLMHELLCHAFQGLKSSGRRPVDTTCAWSEGWMDGLAWRMTERWLDGDKDSLPIWVRECCTLAKEEGSSLHKRRREPQSSIQPHTLSARVAAHSAASALELAYQGDNPQKGHASRRLFRFSLRLNLHVVPQVERNQIVELLGLALELFRGVRLDQVIGACERFIEHDDWQVLLKELESLTNFWH